MVQVTGGEITFSETKQVEQYEPRRVDVKLAFGIAEGQNIEEALDTVGTMARNKVRELLGYKPTPKPHDLSISEKPRTVSEAEAQAIIAANVAQKPTARGKRSAKMEADNAIQAELLEKAINDKKTNPSQVSAAALPDDTSSNAPLASDLPNEDDDFSVGAAPAITDEVLMSACAKRNARFVKEKGTPQPLLIKALIGKFAPEVPHHLAKIPQASRQQFLDELEKI